MRPKGTDVYVNVPDSKTDGSRTVYCPLCYYDMREVPMVFDVEANTWKCNYCKHLIQKRQNPVGESQITAGNDVKTDVPYMRAVSFTRKSPNVGKNETFNNAAQAWAD